MRNDTRICATTCLGLLTAAALLAGSARAAIPISTVSGDAVDARALNLSEQGGVLSLVWRQLGPNSTDPATLKWSVFSAASAPDEVPPSDGVTISARPMDRFSLTRTAPVGCPPNSFCPSAMVAYTEPSGPSSVRVLRFGNTSGWDVAATASGANAFDPQIASDGETGAVLAWIEILADSSPPRAQRVSSDGALLWGATGVAVAAGVNASRVRISGDGAGGVYVAWKGRLTGEPAVFAMHLDAAGAPVAGWPADGLLLRRGANVRQDPEILADGVGGAYVMWSELEARLLGFMLQPRISRINSDGSRSAGWSADGNQVAPLADSPVFVQGLVPDGVGGVLVACTHFIPGGASRVMVQRLNGDGSRPAGWPASGLEGCNAPGDEYQPAVVGQSGGAVLVWSDARSGEHEADVYGARFLADGSRAAGWPAAGLPITVAPSVQRLPMVGTGVDEKVLVAWTDMRPANESGWDLRGVILSAEGLVVSVPSRSGEQPAMAITSPNPSRGAVRGVFTLAARSRVLLEVHDVAGRCVARLVDGEIEAGPNSFEWDPNDASGSAIPSGVYFVSLRSAEGMRSLRVVIAR